MRDLDRFFYCGDGFDVPNILNPKLLNSNYIFTILRLLKFPHERPCYKATRKQSPTSRL